MAEKIRENRLIFDSTSAMEANRSRSGIDEKVETKDQSVPKAMQATEVEQVAAVPDGTDYETVFTTAKAGMQGVDLQKVKQVVFEMSKDSKHYHNEQRKMKQVEERIRRLHSQAATLTSAELGRYGKAVDAKIAEMEAKRDLTRTWLHVDMDAFFAAVEERDDPSLKGKPFAVGGISMISTASYAARKYGVRSAMPGFIAVKLCPDLIFVPPRFDKYAQTAETTRKVFQTFDPDFEAGSLDEAYLDITSYCQSHNVSGSEVAMEIRRQVKEQTDGLTCSCGVACNRTLAKICSDIRKPDGQYVLEPQKEVISSFVSTLPIRKWPGIGRVTEHILSAFDVHLCGDILRCRDLLSALFSSTSLDFFLHCALGLGDTTHPQSSHPGDICRKGISVERTFPATRSFSALEAKARDLADRLAEHMAEEGLRGKTLTLKLKLSTFEIRTRAVTLDRYIQSSEEIFESGMKLLRAELPLEIRLMGFRMSNFLTTHQREKGQITLEEILKQQSKKQRGQQQEHHRKEGEDQLGPEDLVAREERKSIDLAERSHCNLIEREIAHGLKKLDDACSGKSFSRNDASNIRDALMNASYEMKNLGDLGSDHEWHTERRSDDEELGSSAGRRHPCWVCSVCTFAENKRGVDLCCALCETPRSGRVRNPEKSGDASPHPDKVQEEERDACKAPQLNKRRRTMFGSGASKEKRHEGGSGGDAAGSILRYVCKKT